MAGNDGSQYVLPSDNFNGMTIVQSERINGVYRKVGVANYFGDDAEGDRTSVDLMAPGEGIEVITGSNTSATEIGTSYATPHVTGTVALLQEFGDEKIASIGGVHWGKTTISGPTARRHEVMKAVLLNSADKVAGVHGSKRTVVANDDFGNYDWEHSPAYFNPTEPLDIQMGAGHLNARRAAVQFESGEWDNDNAAIPLIGWDWGETGGPTTLLRYPFQEQLAADEYIAITMAWDRRVENFSGTFVNNGFNDLDVFLVPQGQGIDQAVAYSVSTVDTVEHIFAKVPTAGNYDILVYQWDGGPSNDQAFALAWWYGDPFSLVTLGDFDNDGDVDGRDFLTWQRNTSVGDLSDWQNNYGFGTLAASTAVPEPGCLTLLLPVALLLRRRNVA